VVFAICGLWVGFEYWWRWKILNNSRMNLGKRNVIVKRKEKENRP